MVQQSRLRLDDPLDTILTELRGLPVGTAPIRDLLNHSAGLAGWRPLFERFPPPDPARPIEHPEALREMVQLIADEPLEYVRGAKSVYSDLGFILLAAALERMTGRALDRECNERIYAPLGAAPLGYRPIGHPLSSEGEGRVRGEMIAPTEFAPRRGRLLRGEVHDDNAAAIGGVAGHAGLFGTAHAVATVAAAWLDAWHGRPSLLDTALVHMFTRRQSTPDSTWALGWDTPSAESSAGRHVGLQAFGHLGFTGTSLWIDPRAELVVVLLSNRVNLGRDNTKIHAFRPRIHDLVYQTVAKG